MITSKEVFAKRKEGAIDEAYQMALQLMSAPKIDDWDFKAFGWCLIDLIKRDARSGDLQNLAHYRQQLEDIKVDPGDEVLQKGVRNALSLCNPLGHLISEAKELSKQKRHSEAANLYRKVCASGAADMEIQTSFGWELYHLSKQLMAHENVILGAVKRNLHDYLKLGGEKPSLLHSRFLQLAAKLAGQDTFNMLVFSRLWNLEYLRPEDFDRYHAEDGKEYPSLAEKVIQQASKEAIASDNVQDLNYILLHIDSAIERFPDNIWLKLNKAKVLLALGRHDDALEFGLEVTKSKVNDYWAWELLGDIFAGTDSGAVLSCYCKALLCSADDKYTGKVRLKLAQRMAESDEFAAAKHEVEAVLLYREKEGQKIPEVAAGIASQPWFAETQSSMSNLEFYKAHASAAESLLFSKMPWIGANVGDKFTIPGKENKPKRKIFVKTSSVPMEVSIPESKFEYANLAPGDGLQIKGEFDSHQRFQIYVVENRSSDTRWDIFPEKIGVVDHVNKGKNLLHFIVDRDLDGIVPFSELTSSFKEGDAIAVRLSRYSSKNGQAYHVLDAVATDKLPSTQVKKEFCEEVRVSNGMGFTESDIFISPPLVTECQISDGQKRSGTAVLNYNKKRASWGWKAIEIVDPK